MNDSEDNTLAAGNEQALNLGTRVLRAVLAALLIAAVFSAYAFCRFRGLKDAESMDLAQVGRNLARGQGFATQCIRPVDMGMLADRCSAVSNTAPLPDIRHAPAYPAALAAGFRLLKPSFTAQPETLFAPETRVIVPLGILFSVGTAIFLYLLGLHLFNPRVAWISLLIFVFSRSVLDDSLSGLPVSLMSFLATAAAYAAFRFRSSGPEHGSPRRWLVCLPLAALACAAAVLTGYAMIVLAVSLAVLVSTGFPRRGWLAGLAFLLVVALAAAPWLARNNAVSDALWGSAPASALRNTLLHEGDSVDRRLAPGRDNADVARILKAKLAERLPKIADGDLKTVGNGIIVALFLVSLFHRFTRDDTDAFKWCAALAVGLAVVAAALFCDPPSRILNAFLPLMILLGTGFFIVMLEFEDFVDPLKQTLLTWILVAVTALPALVTVLGPRPSIPYPPYYPPFVAYVSDLLEPEETLCTDIPWATAWYGDRTSLLLPVSTDEFLKIHPSRARVSGLYLTTVTGNRPYVGQLLTGPESSWLPLLNLKIPPGFPLAHGINLPKGTRDQLFLTDRVRWKTPEPETSPVSTNAAPADPSSTNAPAR